MGTISRVSRNYDLIAAVAGLIIGIIVIITYFVRMQNKYLITLGLVFASACLFYLFFRKKLLMTDDATHQAGDNRSYILIINIVFLLVFTASIYTLHAEAVHRPLSYFLLTSLACAVIAVEIIIYSGSRGQICSILGKILLVALSLRCSEYFGFAGIVGIDPWSHYEIIRDLLSQGHMQQLISGKAINSYLAYPMMHLYTGMMSNICGGSLKDMMFLAVALPEVLSTIFVFLLGRELIGIKGALLTALMISFSDFHIQWGTQIIAMSFGVALVSLAIYLVMSRQAWSNSLAIRVMMIVSFGTVILTHTVTAFVLFIGLLALYIMVKVYKLLNRTNIDIKYGSVTLLLLFAVGMLAQWIYSAFAGRSFLDSVVIGMRNSLTVDAALLARPEEVVGPQEILFSFGSFEGIPDILGFAILFCFGVIASLLWLSKAYQDIDRVSLIGMIVALFIVPFGFSLFGIRNVLPYRWFVFMYIPLTVMASFAIVKILTLCKRMPLRILSVTIITFVLSFFMITSTISNTDSPVFKKGNIDRLLYTAQEMRAAESITEVYDGRIILEGHYGSVFGHYLNYKGGLSILRESWTEGQLPEGMLVWREHMGKGPIWIVAKNGRFNYVILKEGYERKLSMERLLIYSNPQVRAYLTR